MKPRVDFHVEDTDSRLPHSYPLHSAAKAAVGQLKQSIVSTILMQLG